jgi:hypothetical protein
MAPKKIAIRRSFTLHLNPYSSSRLVLARNIQSVGNYGSHYPP